MSEPTTALTFQQMHKRLMRYLFNATTGNTAQTLEVNDIINDGYRMFLSGVDPRDSKAHRWNFMEPAASLTVAGSTGVASLPANFGGLKEDFTYTSSSIRNRLRPANTADIRAMWATGSSTTGYPYVYSIEPTGFSSATGQRYQVLFYPKTGSTMTFNYRYRVNPAEMTGNSQYPLGGPQMALVVLQQAMSIAERRKGDVSGPQAKMAEQMMIAAIDADSAHRPRSVGYNADHSEETRFAFSERNTVTYGD